MRAGIPVGAKAAFAAALFGALPLLSGCEEELPDDETLAMELWEAIQGHEAWTQPAGWEGILQSEAHTAYVGIYANDVAAGWDGEGPAPYGAIYVKDNFEEADGTGLVGYSVMWKLEGYSGEGEWFWAAFNPDGTWLDGQIGAAVACLSCHRSSDHDYSKIWEEG